MPEQNQSKQSLIRMILKTHREKFSGQTTEELQDDYYYLWEHGVKGLLDMAMSELVDILIDLNTEE